jgi:alpha-galactosidase
MFLRDVSFAGAAFLPVCNALADSLTPDSQLEHGFVVLGDGRNAAADDMRLDLQWKGPVCNPALTNLSTQAFVVKNVVLVDLRHTYPGETVLYGESFQMLSQTGGTLSQPTDLGYNEIEHYRIPGPSDATVATGLLTLSPPDSDHIILAFTSCRRFAGRFYLRRRSVQAVIETEGLLIGPGETWQLEELLFTKGTDRNALLSSLAEKINTHHPPLLWKRPPTGWCSYGAYGTKSTSVQILDNVDAIARRIPQLTYLQVDDGYQPWLGDWLDTAPSFGEDIGLVMKQIKDRGQEPALWIAPFVADPESNVFQQHPQWFIRDHDGKPLPALKVTFGGWDQGHWYALDGTHPEVQHHLENIFRYIREEWDCRYFKLDATFWGAMHGGVFHDPHATRVEAYRRGMEAIRRGAGEDSFLLGCNHPVWPSFGLIHGSRSSNDIARDWKTFEQDATQTMERNWQNGTLWWNDPDTVCLTGNLTDDEFKFHAAAVYASGGLILSGDDLKELSEERLAVLRKLLPPTGLAAKFDSPALQVGRVELQGATMFCLFNRAEAEVSISIPPCGRRRVFDHFSDEPLGQSENFRILLPPHAGRILRCE